MKDKLDKIEQICEKLDSRLDSVDLTLTRNTITLEEHVRRTNLLEGQVRTMTAKTLPPIVQHVDRVKFLIKLIPWTVGLAGTLFGIMRALGKL